MMSEVDSAAWYSIPPPPPPPPPPTSQAHFHVVGLSLPGQTMTSVVPRIAAALGIDAV